MIQAYTAARNNLEKHITVVVQSANDPKEVCTLTLVALLIRFYKLGEKLKPKEHIKEDFENIKWSKFEKSLKAPLVSLFDLLMMGNRNKAIEGHNSLFYNIVQRICKKSWGKNADVSYKKTSYHACERQFLSVATRLAALSLHCKEETLIKTLEDEKGKFSSAYSKDEWLKIEYFSDWKALSQPYRPEVTKKTYAKRNSISPDDSTKTRRKVEIHQSIKSTWLLAGYEYLTFAAKGLPAGFREKQHTRLSNMAQAVQSVLTQTPVVKESELGEVKLTSWAKLFDAIQSNANETVVIQEFRAISSDDLIKSLLIQAHSQDYIEKLLINSLRVKNNALDVGNDIKLQRRTFEYLVKELAQSLFTLFDDDAMSHVFSFGLPSHHASATPQGFCVLNRIAALAVHSQNRGRIPLIFGVDVNQDNGTLDILSKTKAPFIHIDLCDTEVYPQISQQDIKNHLARQGFACEIKPTYLHFYNAEYLQHYYLFDLKDSKERVNGVRHHMMISALNVFTSNKLMAQCDLYLSIGFDSHKDEKAGCSRCIINNVELSDQQMATRRFDDDDFNLFFNTVFSLKTRPNRVYFGLEGGYTPEVYQRVIKNMVNGYNRAMGVSLSPATPMPMVSRVQPHRQQWTRQSGYTEASEPVPAAMLFFGGNHYHLNAPIIGGNPQETAQQPVTPPCQARSSLTNTGIFSSQPYPVNVIANRMGYRPTIFQPQQSPLGRFADNLVFVSPPCEK